MRQILQELFLVCCRSWCFALLYSQLWLFFSSSADLSFSPGRRTAQSVSIHFPSCLGDVTACWRTPPFLSACTECMGGKGEGNGVVCAFHFLTVRFTSELGERFLQLSFLCLVSDSQPVVWGSVLHRKQCLPLFMGIIAASRDVRDHKNVNIQAVLMDQEISPFGRWGSFVLELENIP